MRWAIAGAGLLVGFIIGLTGMGGGALMTPALVLLFGVPPSAAISSDVIASFLLKPFGGGVHARRGTVNLGLVGWLSVGSVPSALAGACAISRVGAGFEGRVRIILGAVLLVAAVAMMAKIAVDARRAGANGAPPAAPMVRPLPTILIGVAGGLVVGMTSVGSGSLMIVMLTLLYPSLSSRSMVGTDLVQAIPLVGAAALGHLIFGQLQVALTGSVLVGAIPGVLAGAHLSSRADDRYIRPVLVAVLTLSALKLLDVPDAALLGTTAALAVALAVMLVAARRAVAVAPAVPRTALRAADEA